jgi:hypothetical protein
MAPSTRRRILLVLGLVVAAALVVAFRARFLIDPDYYRQLVISRLEQRLGRQVRVSSASVAVWPALGLRLHEVVIDRNPRVPGSPFVAAEGLHVAVRIRPLLQGNVVVDRITIDRPAITVTRDAHGVLSIADLLAERKRRATEKRPDEDAPSEAGEDLFGSRIMVAGGDLTFVDQAAPGGTLTVRVRDLTVDVEPRPHLGPRFSLRASIGPEDGDGTIAVRGTAGRIPEPWRLADLPGDLRLELGRVDLRRLIAYLPAQWRGWVPRTVLTTDLSISGAPADEIAVAGTLRFEQTELYHHPVRVTGTIDAEVDGTHEQGVIQGKATLRLAPGVFRKQDDIVIDGHTDIDATVRVGKGPFAVHARVDATRADFRIKDVFEKKAGTQLVLDADVAPTDGGIAVRDARGHLDHMAVTGHADIGRAPGPGRSTPFGLHVGAMDVDLASAPTLVAATAPFALAGRGRVEQLDILRRPEAKRQWQVTLDTSLAEVHARLPLGDGRAHVVGGLSAEVHIEPGLLRATDVTTHVNGVPLSFDGTANEFMALISGDRDRPRAGIEVAVRGDRIDLDDLLTPGEAPSGKGGDGVSGTSAEEDAPPGAAPSRPFPQRLTIRTGTLDAPEATYLGQPLSDLHLTIGYVPSTLRIDAARFGLHGGRGDVKGTRRRPWLCARRGSPRRAFARGAGGVVAGRAARCPGCRRWKRELPDTRGGVRRVAADCRGRRDRHRTRRRPAGLQPDRRAHPSDARSLLVRARRE